MALRDRDRGRRKRRRVVLNACFLIFSDVFVACQVRRQGRGGAVQIGAPIHDHDLAGERVAIGDGEVAGLPVLGIRGSRCDDLPAAAGQACQQRTVRTGVRCRR